MQGLAVRRWRKANARIRRIIVILSASALGILMVAFLIAGRGGEAGHPQRVEVATVTAEVSTSKVTSGTMIDYSEATGTVRPAAEAQIAPKIMSSVQSVYVHEGDHVRRGQMLMKLEASDLTAQVGQASASLSSTVSQSHAAKTAVVLQRAQSESDVQRARAALSEAREQLTLAMKGPRKQERSQAHLAVAQARAQYKNAEIELARMKRLFEQDAVPKQRVDQAETIYEVAKAQFEAAEQQAEMVEEGSREEEIKTAQARVRQAEEALSLAKSAVIQNQIREAEARTAASEVGRASAALAYARVQQGYSVITSPFDGVVTARMVDPGDTVTPGMPVISIEDNSHFRLEATVPESELSLIEIGNKVEVVIDSANLVTQGKVFEMVPSGDPSSRKFLVKVDLPSDVEVKAGQFGRIKYAKSVRSGVTVPSEAVTDMGGLTAVMVVRPDGKAHMQVVKAGKVSEGMTEIISGLDGGEKVIISGLAGLADGSPVRVRR